MNGLNINNALVPLKVSAGLRCEVDNIYYEYIERRMDGWIEGWLNLELEAIRFHSDNPCNRIKLFIAISEISTRIIDDHLLWGNIYLNILNER